MRRSTSTATAANGAAAADRDRLPGNLLRIGAALLGLAMASLLMINESRAAFSDTTGNDANSLASGTVVLTDDDADAKMFNLSGLNGGQSVVKCINVTYSGTLTSDVKLYGVVGGTGLAPGLTTKVEVGTGAAGGTTFGCTGFTAGSTLFNDTLTKFGQDHTGYGNGLAGFDDATNPTTKSYRVTMTVSNDNAYQAKTATVGFTWEAQGQDAP